MSRVNDSRDAQRIQQQRMQQEKQKATTKEGAEEFARLVSQKKAESGENRRKGELNQGKRAGQQAAASAALAARTGIQAKSFASMLQKQGNTNLSQGEGQAKVRDQSMRKTESGRAERQAKAEDAAVMGRQDRVEALKRDDRQGGGADGDSGMDHQDQSNQQLGMTDGSLRAAATRQSEGARAAQAAQAPQIPPHVLQEIVKRVMVGVNKEGLSEFHIQFNDDVLGGAGLQISADGGRINAKFTHIKDQNTRRLLKASQGELARAFSAKNLSLETLEVEE